MYKLKNEKVALAVWNARHPNEGLLVECIRQEQQRSLRMPLLDVE